MDPNKVTLRFEAFEKDERGQLIPVCEKEIYSDIIQNMSKFNSYKTKHIKERTM